MITLDKCRGLLEQQEGIEAVEVARNEFVRARFANRVDPNSPHNLVVHPIEEKQALKIVVPEIAKVKSGSELFRVLSHLNYDVLVGKVGVDSHDGEVRVEVVHPCRDGAEEDPSPEVFARLVEVAIGLTHDMVMLATHVGMVEAGVPEDVARKFIEQFRGEGKESGADEETL